MTSSLDFWTVSYFCSGTWNGLCFNVERSLVSFSVLCPPLLTVSSLESFDLDLRSLIIDFWILVICALASFVIGAFFYSVGICLLEQKCAGPLDLFWSSEFLGDFCGSAF